MVWYDGLVKKVNQYEALDYCEKAGLNLPSGYPPVLNESYGKDSDFVTAEKHGIREVFGDMKGRNFWSSSLYPNIYDQAYYFVGASGAVSDARRDYYRDRTAYDSFSARCVGRARVQ